jgi:YtxH-like protein
LRRNALLAARKTENGELLFMTDYERYGDSELYDDRRGHLGLALLFLFVGMGIGAATALMLAPKSGRQMRRQLRRQYEGARDWIDDVTGQAGDLWEKGSDLANEAKKRVKPFADAARHRMS